ncbi:MAG: ECF transporter S component [Firmicutes bacterium]|nr:ECF transporter S component [Bacillota bacterium]
MSWKMRDIVLTAVFSAICGAIYLGWDLLFKAFPIVNPEAQAAFNGLWWIAGGIVPFIIRRPGAALLAEAIGGFMEFALGSPYGIQAFTIGLAQGIGIELGFMLGRYRHYGLGWLLFACGLGGVGNYIYSYFYYGVNQYSALNQIGYLVVTIVSGAVLAGLLSWVVGRGLKRTGVLQNFAVARDAESAAS